MSKDYQAETAELFGDLWPRYNDKLFEESVVLFEKRFLANGFDVSWFKGKRCLDVGCGGGRYSIAMARLGADQVMGCDISASGLADARKRASGLANITFEEASVLELPYRDNSFDFVCCSGVLHHTTDTERGLKELRRVLRPGGKIYLLLYGTGGLRWPTMMRVRPFAQAMGYEFISEMTCTAGLPANRQRIFLDDLFVPLIRFFDWEEIRYMLVNNSFIEVERWEKGKFDHEENISVQQAELKQLHLVFETALRNCGAGNKDAGIQARKALEVMTSVLNEFDEIERSFTNARITKEEVCNKIFGWGHHRVLAVKSP